MAEKLRKKFIAIAVGTTFVVLFVLAAVMNLFNYMQIGVHADELLTILVENDGDFPEKKGHKNEFDLPPKMSKDAPFSTRYFTVRVDHSGGMLAVDTGKTSSASTQLATEYARQALAGGRKSGLIDHYKFQIAQKEYGSMVIFVDCGRDLHMFYDFLVNSVVVCLIGVAAVFGLVLLLSKRAIAPVAQSYAKQKGFITDASHELKTPLSIIGANTDVLELEYGDNQWVQSIRHQVKRLSALVESLVALSRMDEESGKLIKTEFSFSDAVSEAAEPFFAVAEAQQKNIQLDITKNISYVGNEAAIRQLTSLLLDNAVKYAAGGGIVLSLHKRGKKICLKLQNHAEGLHAGDYEVLFGRFYREDVSRNSALGGYGIGLSVAKAIVEQHKGSISAQSPDGKLIIFTALF